MAKSSVTVDIDSEARKILEKRAKREMLTLRELVSDILRRSALSSKSGETSDNVEDKFLSYFSRKGKLREKR